MPAGMSRQILLWCEQPFETGGMTLKQELWWPLYLPTHSNTCQPCQSPEKGCLAAAVGTNQLPEFARADLKGQARKQSPVAPTQTQIRDR